MLGEHEEIKKLLEENLAIVKENHVLLEKMHRMDVYSFWLKFLWFASIIGVPIVAYYFLIEPYFKALGVTSDEIGRIIKAMPHLIDSPFGKIL
jgi:hypothetical protein